MLRKLFFFSFIFFGSLQLSAQEADNDITYGQAINIAARQRMLSQRFTKTLLLKEMGYDNIVVSQERDTCIAQFNSSIIVLQDNFDSVKSKSIIKEITILWGSFLDGINAKPQDSVLLSMMQQNTRLLTLSNKLLHSIEEQYFEEKQKQTNNLVLSDNEDLIDIINISGRQHLLAQRLCLYYLASIYFESQQTVYLSHVKEIFEEFDIAIIQLLQNSYNNDKSREQIARLLFFWEKVKTVEGLLYKLEFDIGDIYEITNKLTDVFENLTEIYQKTYDSNHKDTIVGKN